MQTGGHLKIWFLFFFQKGSQICHNKLRIAYSSCPHWGSRNTTATEAWETGRRKGFSKEQLKTMWLWGFLFPQDLVNYKQKFFKIQGMHAFFIDSYEHHIAITRSLFQPGWKLLVLKPWNEREKERGRLRHRKRELMYLQKDTICCLLLLGKWQGAFCTVYAVTINSPWENI